MDTTDQKCTPLQGKWLVRIILNSFQDDLVPAYNTFTTIHSSLWQLWKSYLIFQLS
jgi:hypothetical protein